MLLLSHLAATAAFGAIIQPGGDDLIVHADGNKERTHLVDIIGNAQCEITNSR